MTSLSGGMGSDPSLIDYDPERVTQRGRASFRQKKGKPMGFPRNDWIWRRERDSNPRIGFTPITRLAGYPTAFRRFPRTVPNKDLQD